MKTIFVTIVALLTMAPAFPQKQLEIMNQRFEIRAIRNGEPVRQETKDFGLKINYETGELYARVNLTKARLFSDEEVEYRIPGSEFLEISGFIPINQIIDNNSVNQTLSVELNLNHMSNEVPVVFKMTLTRIKNASRGFTLVNLNGPTNLRDFGVEDLKGYEPEINIVLEFQTVMVGG